MKTIGDLLNMAGKTAIITGAANGIGKAIAKRFAEAGSNLILIDKDKEGLTALSDSFKENGVKVDCFSFDLSRKESIDEFWDKIEGSKVNILVNNAGVYPFKKFLSLDYSYLEKIMQINLYSILWMCQNMIKKRGKKGGTIVNFGSIEAIMPFKDDLTQYSLSKIGVIALTRDLAREFGRKGFRVNAILPGGILSNGTKAAAKDAIAKFNVKLISDGYNFFQRIPAGRLGDPDEIARMVLVLSSEMSSYMYGAIIPVDGGFLSA